MPDTLLETKLHTPRRRRALVPRPRLDALLDRAWDTTLTLVAGPAGFGKTTLLADWSSRVAGGGRRAAWLSLDDRDSEASTFWTYVVGSLRTVMPEVGSAALDVLRAPHAPLEAALEALLNDLQCNGAPVVLVLDDYHLVHSLEVQQGMTFLIDHLPSTVHIVIATRADPALPLARLRARGELVELRAGELRFTAGEATSYLRDTMGLALDETQVTALDQRTEGWIAGLQLAALSMQGRTDLNEFIAAFSGDDRYLVDYLVEEVLQRQGEPVRRFLLETSILHRMSGPLCDAVTGGDDGRTTLELLDRQNVFVIPLDDRRRWYRYHHLFADVLRARLVDEHRERIQLLQRRASAWFAEHDQPDEAVEHAVRGEDYALAAQLIEQALPDMRRDRRESELRRWLEALPGELIAASPVLTIAMVGALMAQGELDGVDMRLRDAERWLEIHGSEPATSGGTLRTLASNVAMFRAGQARMLGDVAATIQHAQRAHDLSTDDDHLERGAAAALLGLAHWSNGQLGDAHRGYTEALRHLSAAGHLSDVLGCTLALSDMEVARGNLDAAVDVLEHGLRAALAAAHPPRGTADMHVGLAALHLERHELDAALEHLAASDELGEHAGLPQNAYRSRAALAQVRLAQGAAPDEALGLLEDAERVYDSDYSPDVCPVPALIARVSISQARLDAAENWARARGLSVDDELSYLAEFEHLTLARLLLARAPSHDDAAAAQLARFLARLLATAEQQGRPGSALEVLVLQALLAQQRGEQSVACTLLAEAVSRAQPQRYVRTIIEHGPPVLHLLRSLPSQRPGSYARHVLHAAERPALAAPMPRQPADRLSDRELEVLRLLASDLDGPDIARQLVVSVHTVRTHTKAIYSKLGVNSRRAAVSRARELELLHSSA